jgi:excisionase family DNA binding protein
VTIDLDPFEQVPSTDSIYRMFLGEPGRPGPAGVVLMVDELADIVRTHPSTIRRFIAAGELPAYRVGRSWRILTKDAIVFFWRQSNRPHGTMEEDEDDVDTDPRSAEVVDDGENS